MSLFTRCSASGCSRSALLRCSFQHSDYTFCSQHAGEFQVQCELDCAPQRLAIALGAEDCEALKQASAQIDVSRCLSQLSNKHQASIRHLLEELSQNWEDHLAAVRAVQSACQTLRAELNALVRDKVAPLDQPGSFASSVANLKRAKNLTSKTLATTIQEYLNLAEDPSVPLEVPDSEPSLVVHPLIKLARENNRNDLHTPKEALEFLCRLGIVFNSQLSLSPLFESLDLRGVDLTGGIFDGVSFNDSNLEGAKLDSAILWNTQFRSCNLQCATVHLPKMQTNWSVSVIASSLCGKYVAFAAGLSKNYLALWKRGSAPIVLNNSQTTAIVFSPDSTYLVSGDKTGDVKVWDIESKLIYCSFSHSPCITALAFSSNKHHIAVGSSAAESNLKVWDLVRQAEVLTFTAHSGSVGGLSYSSCGNYLVSGGRDQKIRVWKASSSFAEHHSLDELAWQLHSSSCPVKFVPKSTHFVSGGHDGGLKIWDAERGVCLNHLSGHNKRVISLDISEVGQYIVTGDAETKTVELYSQEEHLHSFEGHNGPTNCAAISPCGRFVVSGGVWDRLVLTWVNWKMLVNSHFLEANKAWPDRQYSGIIYQQTQLEGEAARAFIN